MAGAVAVLAGAAPSPPAWWRPARAPARHAFEQRDFDVLRQPGARRDRRLVRHVAWLADLDRVRRRGQTQGLLRRAARASIDEELRVGRRRAHDHFTEDRLERHLDRPSRTRCHRHLARRRFVAFAGHRDRLRDVGSNLDLERRAAAVHTADRDVGTGRRAAHRETPVRNAEPHRADVHRFVGLDQDVAHPCLVTSTPQLEPVIATHELELDGRGTARLPPTSASAPAGSLVIDTIGPSGHELRRKPLQAVPAFDLDFGREIEVPLGVDQDPVRSGRQLELAGRAAGRLAVDAHLSRHRQLDLQAPRQRRQCDSGIRACRRARCRSGHAASHSPRARRPGCTCRAAAAGLCRRPTSGQPPSKASRCGTGSISTCTGIEVKRYPASAASSASAAARPTRRHGGADNVGARPR